MANPQKAPRPNGWITTLVSAVIIIVLAIVQPNGWFKGAGFVVGGLGFLYAIWLFRREWLWEHRLPEVQPLDDDLNR